MCLNLCNSMFKHCPESLKDKFFGKKNPKKQKL